MFGFYVHVTGCQAARKSCARTCFFLSTWAYMYNASISLICVWMWTCRFYRKMDHFTWSYYEMPSCLIHIPITSNNWLTFISTAAYIFPLKRQLPVFTENLNKVEGALHFSAENPDKLNPVCRVKPWKHRGGSRTMCVNMYTLLYVGERERWQPATVNSLTGPPSSSLSSAEANFGMRASSSIARLRHSSARPSGTQSLCRFLGSFTVCQITASSVLSVALLEHLLLMLPCQGLLLESTFQCKAQAWHAFIHGL